MYEDGSGEESGEDILPARDLSSPAALRFIPVWSFLKKMLLEKGGGGARHLPDAPFGQGLVKASINVCIAVRLSADAGIRLMPVRRGEGC